MFGNQNLWQYHPLKLCYITGNCSCCRFLSVCCLYLHGTLSGTFFTVSWRNVIPCAEPEQVQAQGSHCRCNQAAGSGWTDEPPEGNKDVHLQSKNKVCVRVCVCYLGNSTTKVQRVQKVDQSRNLLTQTQSVDSFILINSVTNLYN